MINYELEIYLQAREAYREKEIQRRAHLEESTKKAIPLLKRIVKESNLKEEDKAFVIDTLETWYSYYKDTLEEVDAIRLPDF